MITLMLLELCVRYFAGTAPTLGDPEGCKPSAPKVRIGQKCHASGTLQCRGEGRSGGTPRKPNAIGAMLWTVSALKVPRER
jgi:hypothetical protein